MNVSELVTNLCESVYQSINNNSSEQASKATIRKLKSKAFNIILKEKHKAGNSRFHTATFFISTFGLPKSQPDYGKSECYIVIFTRSAHLNIFSVLGFLHINSDPYSSHDIWASPIIFN